MKQFCTFWLGETLFGVDVLEVQEVIRHRETTEIPLAPAVFRGLLNLRGSIVSCLDLRQRFGMPPAAAGKPPMNIVMQVPTGLVSFQVDRIGDVIEVADEDFEVPPDTLQGDARRLIERVYKLTSGLLLILSVDRVLDLGAEPA